MHLVPVSSFGVMAIVSILVGQWITMRRWREVGGDPAVCRAVLVYAVLAGIVGAKLYFAVDVWCRGEMPFARALLPASGVTWYGALAGGAIGAFVGCRVHGVSFAVFADSACVGAALGHALGRIGCFLAGDDYGTVTDLPWGVSFPQGPVPALTPVHPTQLYETALLLPVAAFLWRRRDVSASLFSEYLVLTGLVRVVVERWRVNPVLALGLTEPQWIGCGLVVVGATRLWLLRMRPPRPRPRRAVPRAGDDSVH